MLNFDARKHDTLEHLRFTARNRARNPATPSRRTAHNTAHGVRFWVDTHDGGDTTIVFHRGAELPELRAAVSRASSKTSPEA